MTTHLSNLRKAEVYAFLKNRVSETARSALKVKLQDHDVFKLYDLDWRQGNYLLSHARGNLISPTEVIASLRPLDVERKYYTESLDDMVDNAMFHRELKQMGLTLMWEHIRNHNTAAAAPYHNNRHMFKVAQIALMLFRAMTLSNEPRTPVVLNAERNLVIACLWHDYDHSQGRTSDVDNIERAVGYFKLSAKKNNLVDEADLYAIERMIRVTEFPFKHLPQTIGQQCIRDADLLYPYTQDTGQILEGLWTELSNSTQPDLTFEGFMAGQRKFLSQAVFFTPVARAIHDSMVEQLIETQELYAQSKKAP